MSTKTPIETEKRSQGVGFTRTSDAPVGSSPTYYLADELTGESAIRLALRLRKLPLSQFQKIVLSFGNVTSLDATGLAILVRLYSQLVTSGRQLVLCDVSDEILTQLKPVGLDSLFRDRPTKGGFLRPISGKFRALIGANA